MTRFIDKLLKYGKVLDKSECIDDNGNHCEMLLMEYTNGVKFCVFKVNGIVVQY